MRRDESYEMYDYARQKIKQKKMLFFHFVVFVLGSILLFCFNGLVQDQNAVGYTKWWPYAVSAWALFIFLHAVNVLIVDRFMGKRWEEHQIKRLVEMQEKRIKELRAKVEKDYPLVDTKRDLGHTTPAVDTTTAPTTTANPTIEIDKQ
ncbi:2TM domain-containing protein [Myroides marinus]|uniref:2TM domain-containing protein n=1 Tax=Myroides marinus TaxID=703342 RepID=A0A1H6WP20_9FLAO|nr:2TM domain-containing protein [Myroides marinus]SEJ15937.1 2TM domain-containing protein [Myroides marinus]